MAHQPFGGKVTVSAIAQNLNALLNIADTTFGPLAIRAAKTADGQAGRIYIGVSSEVTAAGANAVGYLDSGDAIGFDQIGNTHTSAFWLVGSQGDVAYVVGITY